MKIKKIGTVCKGQDGAIWGNHLFRFDTDGSCRVYDLCGKSGSFGDLLEIGCLQLSEGASVIPHSNSVMFGTEYYAPGDEYPLLYSNIYNNRAKEADTMRSYTCVYRITREGAAFHAKLVQYIAIGFVDDSTLWNRPGDTRPYGNFAVDRSTGLYHVFTMLDQRNVTRHFTFRLPKVSAGIPDGETGIPTVFLQPEDILSTFDCPYQYYIQGACAHNGKIYSLEGFTHGKHGAAPALRVISPEDRKEELLVLFGDYGLDVEPEFVDFWGDVCCYADQHGAFYTLDFSK